jgi:hypothetical protein
MKKLIFVALTCAVSLSAYPSEKGGNIFRSEELKEALGDFSEAGSCPQLDVLQNVCGELGEEVYIFGSRTEKAFYKECCENR